jgi:hypothetical protein
VNAHRVFIATLTLSVSLLAASLILAAPAQAETWSCAFVDDDQKPLTKVFKRDGNKYFQGMSGRRFQILFEDKRQIHLYNGRELPFFHTVGLFKSFEGRSPNRFAMSVLNRGEGQITFEGNCTVH